MAEEAARSRLGRGLAALIGDVDEETTLERARGQRRVPIESLRPNPRNPRQLYSEVELDVGEFPPRIARIGADELDRHAALIAPALDRRRLVADVADQRRKAASEPR